MRRLALWVLYLLHLLLEVPDPRLPAVLTDEQVQGVGRDLGTFFGQTADGAKLRDQIALETHGPESLE